MDARLFQQPLPVFDAPPATHAEDETLDGAVKAGVIGTAAAELTPRLPISMDPKGMPGRATPPGVVGVVDAVEEATPLEPEPHIPDNPELSSIPEVADISDDVDIPDIAVESGVAPVAGIAVPIVTPPPSKVAADPNIPVGEVPLVEHVVPLLAIEAAPVTPMGAGLTPGDAISVEPKGMPVGETAEPVPMPSGDVAPMVGVGLAMPVTCASATLQVSSAGMATATNENLIGIFRLRIALHRGASIGFAAITRAMSLSDIAQSLVVAQKPGGRSAASRCFDVMLRAASASRRLTSCDRSLVSLPNWKMDLLHRRFN